MGFREMKINEITGIPEDSHRRKNAIVLRSSMLKRNVSKIHLKN